MTYKRLVAFDFDGVLCDSARELAVCGLLLGEELKQGFFPSSQRKRLEKEFVKVRPLLETGFESVVLCALLLKKDVDDVLQFVQGRGMKNCVDDFCSQNNTSIDSLKAKFTKVRKAWMESDAQGWLMNHEFYNDAVRAFGEVCKNKLDLVVVITTKQKEFAFKLLHVAAVKYGIPFISEENVFGLEEGTKTEVLNRLIEKNTEIEHVIFIEDRVETLETVEKGLIIGLPSQKLDLIMALWGYNLTEQKNAAKNLGYLCFDQGELLEFIKQI